MRAARPGGVARAVAAPVTTLALACVLAGCSAAGGIIGAVAGATSGSASGNPGVGIAVAIGVKTAIDESLKIFDRYWQHEEQQSIAAQIGATPVGEQRPWQVRHPVSYEDKQGRLRVLRAFTTPLAECKEALFSVEQGDGADAAASPNFVTTVCRAEQDDWQWALAEPAVARWGALH